MGGGIDHLVIVVNDLEDARAFYQRIGFNMTPLAFHPFGTANTLAQLDGSFLEVLSVADESLIPEHGDDTFSFAAYNRDFLSFAPGCSMLVFESTDARADQQHFLRQGLDTYAPFDFSRKATLPDGSEVTVGFSLAFVTHREMARSVFFTCEQHAPEHFWKPEYQTHANTAQTTEEVAMVAEAPQRYKDFFRGLCPTSNVALDGETLTVATPRGRVCIYTAAGFESRFRTSAPVYAEEGPRFAGISIGVADPARATTKLVTSGTPHAAHRDGVVIAGADAFGLVIEFVDNS